MKKIIFTLALLVQVGFAMAAAPNKNSDVNRVTVSNENVKMFQQAGTSTNVLATLNASDYVTFVRQHNAQWAIVTVNGQAGYVLMSEIAQAKK